MECGLQTKATAAKTCTVGFRRDVFSNISPNNSNSSTFLGQTFVLFTRHPSLNMTETHVSLLLYNIFPFTDTFKENNWKADLEKIKEMLEKSSEQKDRKDGKMNFNTAGGRFA